MKVKNILLVIFIAVITISAFSMFFSKDYKVRVIKNIDTFAFNDTILYVHDYKDSDGPGVQTTLKNYDTSFCFSGYNKPLHEYYFTFAKKGDVLIKKKNADSFYIKRGDSIIGFALGRCQ